jgi:hypothetical protein
LPCADSLQRGQLTRREIITVKESQDTLFCIAATVKAELLEFPGVAAEAIDGCRAAECKEYLDSAILKILAKVTLPEGYFEPRLEVLKPIA